MHPPEPDPEPEAELNANPKGDGTRKLAPASPRKRRSAVGRVEGWAWCLSPESVLFAKIADVERKIINDWLFGFQNPMFSQMLFFVSLCSQCFWVVFVLLLVCWWVLTL